MVNVVEGVLGFSDSGVGDECFQHGPTLMQQSLGQEPPLKANGCVYTFMQRVYIYIYAYVWMNRFFSHQVRIDSIALPCKCQQERISDVGFIARSGSICGKQTHLAFSHALLLASDQWRFQWGISVRVFDIRPCKKKQRRDQGHSSLSEEFVLPSQLRSKSKYKAKQLCVCWIYPQTVTVTVFCFQLQHVL